VLVSSGLNKGRYIFYDSEARLESAARTDASVLTAEGYIVVPGRTREGKREATVSRRDETMQLEWVTDAAFRFFSTQPDELFRLRAASRRSRDQ
jgi:hypothetical protein